LRDKPEAQWEIRKLAQEMGNSVSELYPIAWAAYLDTISKG